MSVWWARFLFAFLVLCLLFGLTAMRDFWTASTVLAIVLALAGLDVWARGRVR